MKNTQQSSTQNLNETQTRAKQYLEKHNIPDIITDMINTITHHYCPDPVITMIHFLYLNHANKQELQSKGIQIDEKFIQIKPVLCIPYPTFPSSFKGLIKNTLTREQFSQCKNFTTSHSNELRKIFKISAECADSTGDGIFLLDSECYSKYDPIIKPIIQQNSRETNSFQFIRQQPQFVSYDYSFLDPIQIQIDECRIKIKRNIENQCFVAAMKPRFRGETQGKIERLLTNLGMTVHQIENADSKRLNQLSERLFKKQADLTRKGQFRFPDWPLNRAIGVSSDKNTVCWVNKEDHIDFRTLATKENSVEKVFKKAEEFLRSLEKDKDIKVEFSEQYGYMTVKPRDSGLGINFQMKIRLQNNDSKKIKPLAKKKFGQGFYIKTYNDKYIILATLKSARMNYSDLLQDLNNALAELFEQVNIKTQSPSKIIPSEVQQIHRQGDAAIQINNDFEKTDDQPEKMEIEEQQSYYSAIPGNCSLSTVQSYYEKVLFVKQYQPPLKAINLVETFTDDIIYHQKDMVVEKFFLARRNLKNRLSNNQIVYIMENFFKEKVGKNIKVKREQQEDVLTWLIKRQILTTQDQISGDVTKIEFLNKNQNLTVICCLDDDYIFCYDINLNSMSQSFYYLAQKLNEFEDFLREKSQTVIDDPKYGYLTNNPINCGYGIEIIYILPKKEIDYTQKQPKEIEFWENLEKSQIVIKLSRLSQETVLYYCQYLNQIFTKMRNSIKWQHGRDEICINYSMITELAYGEYHLQDTGQLQAVCLKSTQLFEQKFRQYLSNKQIKNFVNFEQVTSQWIKQQHININELAFENHLKTNFESFPENLKAKIILTVSRNFKNEKFCREMSVNDLKNMKIKIKSFLDRLGFTNDSKSLEGDTYSKIFENQQKKIEVLICGTHHFQILLNSVAHSKQLSEKLAAIQTVLQEIKKNYEFASDPHFGYLGPQIHQCFMSGVTLTIKMNDTEKNIEDICKNFGYTIKKETKCKNPINKEYDKENQSKEESEPLLQNQKCEQKTKLLINADRPCYLPFEYNFLNELGKFLKQ